VRLFKKFEAFIKHLKINEGFLSEKSEAFSKITGLFEDIFTRIEALLKRYKAFSKNSRLFKLFSDKWVFLH
jgi:hypothetical protein